MDFFSTPGPGPIFSPWGQNGDILFYDQGGLTLTETVTGGDKGPGTVNAAALYVNGVPLNAATVRQITSGSAATMTVADSELVINKGTGSPTAVTLPVAPPFGTQARVSDGKGDASTNPISVSAAAGGTINGATGALPMDVNWETTLFRSLGGNNWSIL